MDRCRGGISVAYPCWMDSPLADVGVIDGINNYPGDQDAEWVRDPDYLAQARIFAAGRAGTLDEVGTVGALLMCPSGAPMTGSDFLMYGGVSAAYRFGDLASQ